MQVLAGAGAGLQEDMMTHIVMCTVQTTRQEYQLARPFLHGGTVMRNDALLRVLVSQFWHSSSQFFMDEPEPLENLVENFLSLLLNKWEFNNNQVLDICQWAKLH